MQKISKEQWNKHIHFFSSSEFSEDPLLYSDFHTIKSLDFLRNTVGYRIFPSPISGTLARFSGSSKSQHFVGSDGKERKSTAVDVFIEGNSLVNWSFILSSFLFKGVGIYLDTEYNYRPWPMFHLDTREKGFMEGALIWMRYRGDYYYPQLNPKDKLDFRNIMTNNILLKENLFKAAP